jgi:glycogen(starch) synthase
VASYVEEKGLFYLINAVSHLRDATCKNLRLLIVGAGYLEERLARQIQQKRLDKITKLVGSVPHNEVIKLLKLSKAFVLPSLVSVFDLAVLEAMAAKTPIITTAVGGNLEMLDSQSALLVPPKDSRTLASAIEAVLDNNQLCSSIANKSRNRVVTHFSLEAMLAQYFSLYEEILVQ